MKKLTIAINIKGAMLKAFVNIRLNSMRNGFPVLFILTVTN
ncbi:Uncharacterised protein [Bacillus freudenreichii]|nr:Uncharacterised protein [Bacillus freudenreichii]